MRYADLQYSASMGSDWIISFSEVFELTEKQTLELTKLITTLLQDKLEIYQRENENV